ncbi:MAG: asparagine synthase [Thermoplasmatales archaeon]|nr:asparagine synthase [Thermoplasmatales archaeon]
MEGCETLSSAIGGAVKASVGGKDAAVAFSGGLDSGIVAAFVKRHASSATLYTAGVADAYDVRESESASRLLDMPWRHLLITDGDLLDCVADMVRITGTTSPVTLSFEIPLYYVAKHCREDTIIGGQGADELFAGFSKYVGLDEVALGEAMGADMAVLLNQTLAHERAVASNFGKTVAYPYLDRNVVDFVSRLDVGDLMPSEVRKGCLRDVAEHIGYPEIAAKKKKAAQYGCGAMHRLRAIAKSRGVTVKGLIDSIAGGV